jgi:hypothetical protein
MLALLTHSSPALRVFSSRSLCAGSARAWREPQASALESLTQSCHRFGRYTVSDSD